MSTTISQHTEPLYPSWIANTVNNYVECIVARATGIDYDAQRHARALGNFDGMLALLAKQDATLRAIDERLTQRIEVAWNEGRDVVDEVAAEYPELADELRAFADLLRAPTEKR